MARLRVRLEVKRPQPGLPLDRLAELADRAQKLVRIVGKDAPLDGDGYWIARNFKEGSLSFDIEYIGEADDDQVRHYNQTLTQVISYRPNGASGMPSVPGAPDAVIQWAKIGEAIDVGEAVHVGIYEGEDAEVPQATQVITKRESLVILELLEAPVEYHGMVQGIIHSLFKESNPAHFDLRELATADLVRCYYTAKQYPRVAKALQRRDAVVLVAGEVKASRITRKVAEIAVSRVEEARRLSDRDYERFFGCAPGMTGKLSTSAFISRVRQTHGD